MSITPHPFLQPSPFESDAGHLIGRDPRTVTDAEWSAHRPDVVVGMKAIRAKCLDCCGGGAAEVRKCVCIFYPLWPLRMGSQPRNLRTARGVGTDTPEPATSDENTIQRPETSASREAVGRLRRELLE